MPAPRRSKYHSRITICASGHRHSSRLEAEYCDQLRLLKKAGEITGYESQKRFELKVNGHLISAHVVDFLVTAKDGKSEVHETKGYATRDWTIKRKLFEAIYPQIKYYVVVNERRQGWWKPKKTTKTS